jgi:hypothetical protein
LTLSEQVRVLKKYIDKLYLIWYLSSKHHHG